jgi:hypothetical protein
MMIASSSHISCVCFIGSGERAEIYSVFVFTYPGAPPTFPQEDALFPAFIIAVNKSITTVLGFRGLSQINNTVICLLSVYVINFLRWPTAVYVKPSKPMGFITSFMRANY